MFRQPIPQQDNNIDMDKGTYKSTIHDIKGRQIYDSRGFPTVECEVTTGLGTFRASVPSGASTGKYQAHELRDNDPKINLGKSVYRAVQNINSIIRPALISKDCRHQSEIDKLMYETLDGSKSQYGWSKAKLGANAILAVSMAVCRAAAALNNLPLYAYIRQSLTKKHQEQKYALPCPAFNVINGGKHGGNELAMQQFMILPTGATNFREAMQMGSDTYHILKKIIHKKHGIAAVNVGDEGGFAPPISDYNEALDLISEAIKQAGYEGRISIAMDCAASQFYDETKHKYNLRFKSKGIEELKDSAQLLQIYKSISQKYPVVSIEDGFDQDDWEGWNKLTSVEGGKFQVVGDDLLVTNISRIHQAVEKKACNALLLKLNQIGTVTQAIQAAELAFGNGWGVMVSHRSGETEDTFIAHLVVALGTGQIKTGAPCRSERLAKYNQLLRIQEELKDSGYYAADKCFKRNA